MILQFAKEAAEVVMIKDCDIAWTRQRLVVYSFLKRAGWNVVKLECMRFKTKKIVLPADAIKL